MKGQNTGQAQTRAGGIVSTQEYGDNVYERTLELVLELVEFCGGRNSDERL